MQQIDLPARFNIPFGNGAGAGYIRTIPQASQPATLTDAPASLTDGFPPATFLPRDSGGIPPNGEDWNGILNQITDNLRWMAAGGPAIFQATFSAQNGGYPRGAMLSSVSNPGDHWISIADGNTTDPDSASASNWVKYGTQTLVFDGSGNWKRTTPDGFVEMGGIYPGPIPSGSEYSFTFTFPFGGFSSQFLGMTAMTRNTTANGDGDTTFQEVSATKASIVLYVNSDQGSGSKDRAGGMRWRAWGI